MGAMSNATLLMLAFKTGMDECDEAIRSGSVWRRADRRRFAEMFYAKLLKDSHKQTIMPLKGRILDYFVEGASVAFRLWEEAVAVDKGTRKSA